MITENLTFEVYGVVIPFSTNSSELMREIRKDFGSFETQASPKTDGRMMIIETYREFPLRIPEYAIRETIVQAKREGI